jgi:hypothetical protein
MRRRQLGENATEDKGKMMDARLQQTRQADCFEPLVSCPKNAP